MPKILDLTGQRFGKLVVIKRVQNHGSKTYWLCKCDCGNEKEIQTSNLTLGRTTSCGCGRNTVKSLMSQLSDEEFKNIVLNSFSFAEIVRACGFTCVSGNSEKIIKDRITQLQLDISHFKQVKAKEKWTPEEIFINNSPVTQSTLRRYYKQGEYSEYKCSICGLLPFWNGKELTLTLDHINGNNRDDRLENLRWVCPNCDRQLDTFGSKNKRIQFNW